MLRRGIGLRYVVLRFTGEIRNQAYLNAFDYLSTSRAKLDNFDGVPTGSPCIVGSRKVPEVYREHARRNEHPNETIDTPLTEADAPPALLMAYASIS